MVVPNSNMTALRQAKHSQMVDDSRIDEAGAPIADPLSTVGGGEVDCVFWRPWAILRLQMIRYAGEKVQSASCLG